MVLNLEVEDRIHRQEAIHDLPAVRQRLAPLALDRRGVRLVSSVVETAASKPIRHVLEQLGHVLVSVQESAGFTVFARPLVTRLAPPRPTGGKTWTAQLLCPSPHPALLSRFAAELTRIVGLWLTGKTDGSLPDALEKIVVELARFAPGGQNTRLLLDAAHRLDVPVRHVFGRTVQFGWGASARWMDSTITDTTSAISTRLARDKRVANRFLSSIGAPVPRQADAPTEEAALAAAASIGFPVVVKPADMDGGVAVTTGIEDEAALKRAYQLARRHSANVVVEAHAPGQDYRLGVVYGRLGWATSREPAGVRGDGVASLRELMDLANRDARRGTRSWSLMTPLSINDEAEALLASQGLGLSDVPEEGRFVRLRSAANISSGGRPCNVRDRVHPDNEDLALRIARLMRLDIAGIDLIIPDIGRSWREVGGAVCEVNAQPQLTVEAPDVAFTIISDLVEGDGRIPVIVILGEEDCVGVDALLQAGRAAGLSLGLALPSCTSVDGRCVHLADQTAFGAVQTLLVDPKVDAVIAVVGDEGWLATGAPIDRIDLLLCTDKAGQKMRSLLSPICAIGAREIAEGRLTTPQGAQALVQETVGLLAWHRGRALQPARAASAAISASPCYRAAPPNPGSIGLCMIARNEASTISASLDSVLGLVDFVLVEDTGSNDGTQDIVRRWLAENAVAGEVIETPWRDFAWNRTQALAHLRARHDIDYALVLDADDLLVREEGFDVQRFKASLAADVYDLTIRYNGLRFPRPQLLRNAKPFGFSGVLHEFVDIPTNSIGRQAARGIHIQAFSRGARSRNPRKYLDDIETLEAALRVEREPRLRARYLFYLAQSYQDAGDNDKALRHFLERADIDFWPEETFVAAYRAAKLQEKLGHREAEATYRRAMAIMSDRQEAYHALSRLLRRRGNYEMGFEVAGEGLLKAPRGGLFVESWIYDYGLRQEAALNAYFSGRFQDCEALCEALLEQANLPERTAPRIRRLLASARDRSAGKAAPNRSPSKAPATAG